VALLKPEHDVNPTTSTDENVNDDVTSLPRLEEKQTTTETNSPVEGTDDAEDSFDEKANEEIMEKDLPDNKEID